jgi:hypothetical protein
VLIAAAVLIGLPAPMACCARRKHEIAIGITVADDALAGSDGKALREHRSCHHAAWNSPFSPQGSMPRQIGKQLRIESAAGESGRELFQIDGREIRFQSACDHGVRQCRRRALPQRKHRLMPVPSRPCSR